MQISFRTVRLVNTPQQEQELGYFVRPILRQSSIGFIAKQTMLVDIVNDSDFWTSDLWFLFDGKQQTSRNGTLYTLCNFILSIFLRWDLINDLEKYADYETLYKPIWETSEQETTSLWYTYTI